MQNVPSKTLEQPEQLKPSQVPIGSKFKFAFELGKIWTYEKISEKYIKCINAPECQHGAIGMNELLCECDYLDIVLFKD